MNHFSCIFSSCIAMFFGFLVRKFCLEFFLFFSLKGEGFLERVWIEESQSSVRGRSPLKGGYCYTSGINTHEGTGIATAAALLRSLPHNGTQL